MSSEDSIEIENPIDSIGKQLNFNLIISKIEFFFKENYGYNFYFEYELFG